MLEIAVATCTETGRREVNEDKVRVVAGPGPLWLALLADGAGGHRGGAEASQRTVDGLARSLQNGVDFSAAVLNHAVLGAHAAVRGAQPGARGGARMHSTVVALWLDTSRARALWSHVGDSRLYRIRDGHLDLLTADDSVVQRLVDAGLLTPRQADAHPQKNQLIAALGVDGDIEPHTLLTPEPLEDGDAFLLCSDGWWGALETEAIASSFAAASSVAEWLLSMHRGIEASRCTTQDNFSAIGVWIGGRTQAPR